MSDDASKEGLEWLSPREEAAIVLESLAAILATSPKATVVEVREREMLFNALSLSERARELLFEHWKRGDAPTDPEALCQWLTAKAAQLRAQIKAMEEIQRIMEELAGEEEPSSTGLYAVTLRFCLSRVHLWRNFPSIDFDEMLSFLAAKKAAKKRWG